MVLLQLTVHMVVLAYLEAVAVAVHMVEVELVVVVLTVTVVTVQEMLEV